MSRSVIAAAVVGLAVLAGCGGTTEPSAPPTSEDALTTATAEPEVVEETTEAAPTTEEPEETVEADAAEMDQSEEGAEAFVEHYIDTLSDVHQDRASVDDLRELALDNCQTCAGFADAADEVRFGHEYVRHISSAAAVMGSEARVETLMQQVDESKDIDTVFDLTWRDDRWQVSEIRLSSD